MFVCLLQLLDLPQVAVNDQSQPWNNEPMMMMGHNRLTDQFNQLNAIKSGSRHEESNEARAKRDTNKLI